MIGDKVAAQPRARAATTSIEFLESPARRARSASCRSQEYQSNRYAGFGIASVGGMPRRQAAPVPGLDRGAAAPATPAWLRLLNVRYLVLPQPLEPAPPWLHDSCTQRLGVRVREPDRAAARDGGRAATAWSRRRTRDPRLDRSGVDRDADLTVARGGSAPHARSRRPGATATIIVLPAERRRGRRRHARCRAAAPRRPLVSGLDRHGRRPPGPRDQGGLPAARRARCPRASTRSVFRFESKAMRRGLAALDREPVAVARCSSATAWLPAAGARRRRPRHAAEAQPDGQAGDHPDLQRAREHRDADHAAARRSRIGLHVLVVDDSIAGRDRRSSSRSGAKNRAAPPRAAAVRARWDSAPPTATDSATRSRTAPSTSSRWTPTSRTTPTAIGEFLEARRDADVVLGSRYLNGVTVVNWPLERLILSYLANVYTRWITGHAGAGRHRRVQVLPPPGARDRSGSTR